MKSELEHRIFEIKDTADFESHALELFRFQAMHCEVYANFIAALGVNIDSVNSLVNIPFLPVQFFKTHEVYSAPTKPQITFTSSGTTGQITSRHLVANTSLYEKSFLKSFELFYGKPDEYIITALLPSYLEREGSSLVYMVEKLIQLSNQPSGGFFLSDMPSLLKVLSTKTDRKVLLIGVSFALLDLAESCPMDLSHIIMMETGGMKGRRKELTREELHCQLKKAFNVSSIHSEYGMTELLSQGYSTAEGIYNTPPWMKVLIRDANDPFAIQNTSITGGVNIIDLANIYSCSFIATQDLGKIHKDGTFEILGRFDNSDIRGCNLLIT